MKDIKRSTDVLITEVELMYSSAERVYEWYEKRCDIDGKIEIKNILDEILEVKLLDRNERLISLAIAKYGVYPYTVRKIFNKAFEDNDEVMTLACFSNTVLARVRYSISSMPDSLVENNSQKYEWFSSLNKRQITTLFENPTIEQDFLADFLSGNEYWNLIDDEMRIDAITALCNNPRMMKRYEDKRMDGYAEYTYGRVFTEAWKLCETVPVNKDWAMCLGKLYSNIAEGPRLDVDSVAKRWMVIDEDEKIYEKGKKFYLNGYERVRAGIYGWTISNKYTKGSGNKEYFESQDIALRWASYRKLDITIYEIKEAYERDGLLAIDAMLEAYNIWSNKESRQALKDICWDASERYENNYLDSANHFNYILEKQEKKHPEWFEEKDEEEIIDTIDKPITYRLTRDLLAEGVYPMLIEISNEATRIEKESKKRIEILLVISGCILFVIFWKLL